MKTLLIIAIFLQVGLPTLVLADNDKRENVSSEVTQSEQVSLEKLLQQGGALARCSDNQVQCRIGISTWCCTRPKKCNYDPPGCKD